MKSTGRVYVAFDVEDTGGNTSYVDLFLWVVSMIPKYCSFILFLALFSLCFAFLSIGRGSPSAFYAEGMHVWD